MQTTNSSHALLVAEQVHVRLMTRYGAEWTRLYEAVPADAMAADWASQITGLTPPQVRYALDNLPDRPPNASAFRALARSMPQPGGMPALPEPSTRESRERTAAAMAEGMRRAAEARKGYSEREWAIKRLRKRIARGGATEVQRDMLRRLERDEAPAGASFVGGFTPIPANLLPPGMRADLEREQRGRA